MSINQTQLLDLGDKFTETLITAKTLYVLIDEHEAMGEQYIDALHHFIAINEQNIKTLAQEYDALVKASRGVNSHD